MLQRVGLKHGTGGEAMKQAEVCHTTAACALQQADRDSLLALECQTKVEERWDCQAFMEAFRVAIQACLPKTQGTLLYPLQLLTGNVPLVTLLGMLATAQLQAVAENWHQQLPSQVCQRCQYHK